MKNIRSYVCALFLAGFYAADAGALVYSNPPSWYADLIGKSQNQIFESKPLSLPEARNISPFPKYAKVHFIVDTNDKLGFDNIEQSFDHDNVNRCKTLGFNKTGACGANERIDAAVIIVIIITGEHGLQFEPAFVIESAGWRILIFTVGFDINLFSAFFTQFGNQFINQIASYTQTAVFI